jgi:hypothetical protein
MRNDTNAQAEKAVVKEVQFGQIDVEGLFQIMTHGGSAASASWRRRRSRWTRTRCSSPRATPTTPPTTSPRAPTPAKDHQASWAENPRVQHAWHILFTLARIRKLFEKYKSTFFQSYLKCYREPELLTVVLMVMLLDEEASKDVG